MKSLVINSISLYAVSHFILLSLLLVHDGSNLFCFAFTSHSNNNNNNIAITTATARSINSITNSISNSLNSHQNDDHGNVHQTTSTSLSSTNKSTQKSTNTNIKFRPGISQDETQIKVLMIRNLMNPLNINHERFIVAVNPKNNNDIYGFVQLKPLSSPSSSSNSLNDIRDPNVYNSKPGSGDKIQILKDELNDDIWDEFENEDIDFPNGFGSLPWSKEYKEYNKLSQERRERNELRLKEMDRIATDIGIEQKKNNNNNSNNNSENDPSFLWELASLYVLPQWRNKGIGSELIRKVLTKHEMILERKLENIYLVTLDSTVEWYKRFRFEVTNDPPESMNLEIVVGGFITKVIGSKLVCMKGIRK